MYTVSRGPTRIINRTRRDLSQKLDNLEVNRELRRKNSGGSDDSDQIIMSAPRPTFQTSVPTKGPRNGTLRHGGASGGPPNTHQAQPPPHQFSASHIELVNYFAATFAAAQHELDKQEQATSRQNGHNDRDARVKVYVEKEPHPNMKDFKPFELEAWWGRRLYRKITEDLV